MKVTNLGRFSGRESRRQFVPEGLFALCAILLILKCGSWIWLHAPSAIANGIAFLAVSFALALSVAMIPSTVRRLHDLGLSGWWMLAFVIAQNVMRNIGITIVMCAWGVVEIGVCAYICFWPGDKEANSYGLPVKALDFSWVKWMAFMLAVPLLAEIAAFAWLKCHPVPEPEPEPVCLQVFSSDEMEQKVGALTVEGPLASFEAFRNETRGNSLTLTNLTVLSRGDLGGGTVQGPCQGRGHWPCARGSLREGRLLLLPRMHDKVHLDGHRLVLHRQLMGAWGLSFGWHYAILV